MKRKMLAAKWKLNKGLDEARKYATELVSALGGDAGALDLDIVVCPPFPLLAPLCKWFAETKVSVGAQNVSEYVEGAYTGETGVIQLEGYGVTHVIIGHSERRGIFGESDTLVRSKLDVVLDRSALVPILCVGEPHNVRDIGGAESYVEVQLELALSGIEQEPASRIVVAYEPIWAIGTGVNATPEDAQAMCEHVRRTVSKLLTPEIAREMRILYGGSIKPSNWTPIASGADVDGGLVGGASLDAADFHSLIRISAAADS